MATTLHDRPPPAAAAQRAADPPSGERRRGWGPVAVVLALVVGLAAGIGGALLLGGDDPAPTAPTSGTSVEGDEEALAELPAPDPLIDAAAATSPEAALRGFLAAEAAGEWEASYDFLAADLQQVAYTSAAAWVSAHADFPTITAYRVDAVEVGEDAESATASTLTGFEPTLNRVLGLVPARARTTWTLELAADGLWRVDTTSSQHQPLFPAADGAADAARVWVDARVECADAARLAELEAGLIGSPALADALCTADQPEEIAVSAARTLTDSSAVSPLLNAWGPEVYAWARTVEVGADTPLVAVLAPLGEEWRVVAVLSAG